MSFHDVRQTPESDKYYITLNSVCVFCERQFVILLDFVLPRKKFDVGAHS